jgi:hypothetical protein
MCVDETGGGALFGEAEAGVRVTLIMSGIKKGRLVLLPRRFSISKLGQKHKKIPSLNNYH